MTYFRPFLAALLLAPAFTAGYAHGAAVDHPPAAAFFQKNCVECHDGDIQKGGLRLDTLPAAFDNPDIARQWVEIFDKVSSGEMPPRKKERPAEAERGAFLDWVKGGITTVELAHRHADGRVVLRRLNRSEYENSVRDLLEVDVSLKDLLPEDSSSMGFDNVAAALSVSSVLLEQYLEAADVALDAAIVSGAQPPEKTWSVSYGPMTTLPNDFRLKRGVRLDPDGTFRIFNPGDLASTCDRFKAPIEGRYRFRIPAWASHNDGKPLLVSVLAGSFDARNPRNRTIGFFELPPDKPRVIEFEEFLPKGGTFKLIAHKLPKTPLDKENERAAYEGAGVSVGMVEAVGPLYASWPPPGHRRLFGDLDLKTATAADAGRVLRRFIPAAFRRKVSDSEIAGYLALVQSQLDVGKTFEESIRAGLKAVLCSPEFLFLRETPGHLDPYAVASRLSYFFWSTTPDPQLLDLAAAGTLSRPEILHAQVDRLLDDPRSARFTEDFTGQWLTLRQIDFTQPDKRLYPEFDDTLQWSMLKESHEFFDEVLHKDLSLLDFVNSDFVMINARLAELYGIPGISGTEIRRVPLPPGLHRGGILGQAAVLKVTANGTTTSPVVRGAWVMRNLVGRPPHPPPPNIPAVEPDVRGATSIREQLAKHRSVGQCAACHAKIDPAGNALENFDVIGGWRESYRALGGKKILKLQTPDGRAANVHLGPGVDPSDEWLDGSKFNDIDALKTLLLRDPDQIARCLAEKLTVYATGAGFDFVDRPVIDGVVIRTQAKGYGFRTLVHQVVGSDLFLSK